jgi:hypothetical protein
MSKKAHHVDIEIDKLTNSIENAFSGDRFDTELSPVSTKDLDLINRKNNWKFDWKSEFKQANRFIYKLTVQGNPQIVQGLISFSDEDDHLYMHLIESALFNRGKNKVYLGVVGNLVAFLCKESWDRNYEGVIAFISKTRLIEHYELTLEAVHIGNHKMVIFQPEALKLIHKYFKI